MVDTIYVGQVFTVTALSTGIGFSAANNVGVSVSPSSGFYFSGQTMPGSPQPLLVSLSQTYVTDDTATIAGVYIEIDGDTNISVEDTTTGAISGNFGIDVAEATSAPPTTTTTTSSGGGGGVSGSPTNFPGSPIDTAIWPASNQSWSFPLPPPMQWAVFNLTVPPGLQPNPLSLIPTGILTILYLDRTAETFIGVPQTVATAFQTSGNRQPSYTPPGMSARQQQAQMQIDFFNRRIKPVYHELLLIGGPNNLPLFTGDGSQAVWTK